MSKFAVFEIFIRNKKTIYSRNFKYVWNIVLVIWKQFLWNAISKFLKIPFQKETSEIFSGTLYQSSYFSVA